MHQMKTLIFRENSDKQLVWVNENNSLESGNFNNVFLSALRLCGIAIKEEPKVQTSDLPPALLVSKI